MIGRSLSECRIFYLEDDFLIAEETRENIENAGGNVVVCGSVSRALEVLVELEFDAALLDFNLSDSTSVPVARRLKQAGVPILFLTAYGPDILPTDLSSCPLITKPAGSEIVLRQLKAILCASAANDT